MNERTASKQHLGQPSLAAEATAPSGGMREANLLETVTNHIVPRLLLAHRMDAQAVEHGVSSRGRPTSDEVSGLIELAIAQDAARAMERADAMLRAGLSLESLLLDWISEAARLLGEEWAGDERSFADVTLGLGTLHRVVALLRHRIEPPLSRRGLALLLAAPGEQHTLALHVLGDLLRMAGWDAVVAPSMHEEELLAVVSTEAVALVGISVSCSHHIEPLGRMIARARERSVDDQLVVMLGGALDLSSFAEQRGAIFCPTARTALSWLERRTRISR